MAENGLSERVDRIEQKLDKQFSEVLEHFVEQRHYIEFAYDKLGKRMTAGFSRLDQRVDDVDKRLAAGFPLLDQCLTEGFSRLERKFDQVIDTQSRPTSTTSRRARPSKRRR